MNGLVAAKTIASSACIGYAIILSAGTSAGNHNNAQLYFHQISTIIHFELAFERTSFGVFRCCCCWDRWRPPTHRLLLARCPCSCWAPKLSLTPTSASYISPQVRFNETVLAVWNHWYLWRQPMITNLSSSGDGNNSIIKNGADDNNGQDRSGCTVKITRYLGHKSRQAGLSWAS